MIQFLLYLMHYLLNQKAGTCSLPAPACSLVHQDSYLCSHIAVCCSCPGQVPWEDTAQIGQGASLRSPTTAEQKPSEPNSRILQRQRCNFKYQSVCKWKGYTGQPVGITKSTVYSQRLSEFWKKISLLHIEKPKQKGRYEQFHPTGHVWNPVRNWT